MEVIKTDCGLCINNLVLIMWKTASWLRWKVQEENWLNEGELCEKGKHLVENLYSPNRVKYPMKKWTGNLRGFPGIRL